MMSQQRWVVAIIAIVAIGIGIIYTTRSDPQPHTVTIGVITPLTGQYGALGESFKKAVTLAAEKNPHIKVVFEDSAFDAKTGLSAYQKLTSVDHVDALIVEDSPSIDTVLSLATKAHMPVIGIFEAQTHENDSAFQMIPFSYPLFSDLAAFASQQYPRIALAYSGAADVYATDAEYFKKGVAGKGSIVHELRASKDSDFRTEVTKLLASNPDAVTVLFPVEDGIKFLKEIRAQKGNRTLGIICDANIETNISQYIQALGTTTFEGCVSTNLPNTTSPSFKQEYHTAYGSDPMIGADWGYDAMTILSTLTTVPKGQWVSHIQTTTLSGASGPLTFDETGTRKSVSERHIFQDGKFVPIHN